jgi:hypothetical protein
MFLFQNLPLNLFYYSTHSCSFVAIKIFDQVLKLRLKENHRFQTRPNGKPLSSRDARFVFVKNTKMTKIYQITTKYTIWSLK